MIWILMNTHLKRLSCPLSWYLLLRFIQLYFNLHIFIRIDKVSNEEEKYILLNICVPIFVVSSITYLILYFTFDLLKDMVSGIVISIAVVFGVKIWRKFHKYQDTLLIRTELKMYLLLTIVSFLIVFAFIILTLWVPKIYFLIHFYAMISIFQWHFIFW